MLNIKAMKEEAEQGLALAEKATGGPWGRGMIEDGEQGEGPTGVHPGSRGEWIETRDVITKPTDEEPDGIVIVEAAPTDGDASFIADSRTRAPAAYRNVVILSDAVATLREALDHVNGLHAHMTKLWEEERAKVRCIHDTLGLEAPVNDQVTLDVEPIVVKIKDLLADVGRLRSALQESGAAYRNVLCNHVTGIDNIAEPLVCAREIGHPGAHCEDSRCRAADLFWTST